MPRVDPDQAAIGVKMGGIGRFLEPKPPAHKISRLAPASDADVGRAGGGGLLLRHAKIMANKIDAFGAVSTLSSKAGDFKIARLNKLSELGLGNLDKLPFSIKILLESCLRNLDNFEVSEEDVKRLAKWNPQKPSTQELPRLDGSVPAPRRPPRPTAR